MKMVSIRSSTIRRYGHVRVGVALFFLLIVVVVMMFLHSNRSPNLDRQTDDRWLMGNLSAKCKIPYLEVLVRGEQLKSGNWLCSSLLASFHRKASIHSCRCGHWHSYLSVNPMNYNLTSVGRYAHGWNSGVNIIGLINHFLIVLDLSQHHKRKSILYCKSIQEPMVGNLTEPEDEHTTINLPNGHKIKLPLKFISLY